MLIHVEESGLFLDIEATEGSPARLLNFSEKPYDGTDDTKRRLLAEVHISGENLAAHHAQKHSGSGLGARLAFRSHSIENTPSGRLLRITQECGGIQVISIYTFFSGLPVMRCRTIVENRSEQEITIEYVTSFCMYQLPMGDWENTAEVLIPHNSWTIECNWKRYSVRDLGLFSGGDFSLKRIGCHSTGSWSTVEFLPMGMLRCTADSRTYFWQIENNGSWVWESGDCDRQLYLQLMGPTLEQGAFAKRLAPSESFESVPAAVGVITGDAPEVFPVLTSYRRRIRRADSDNVRLPVVYNDFIALGSSPSSEKEYPLIDAAARLGCEIFCIDAGWYDTGDWWDKVGEWQVCAERFPRGLRAVTEYIEKKGMLPGLWLEPEVMGIACPSAAALPDDWFFVRFGKRVIDNGRYLLDFRNPEVIKHINAVFERIINDFGIRYFKLDYNVTAGLGTELHADSFGDGLLGHGRAVLDWARSLMERYPGLTIETCASGGCRMDYAMLSVYSMQSVSDQSDYRKVARISAMCATAITPEQAGIWSAPKSPDDAEEAAFHTINTLLSRVHQSGHIEQLSDAVFALLQEGVALYKSEIRPLLPESLPVFPCGLAESNAGQLVYGWINKAEKRGYLAVWRLDGAADFSIPLSRFGVKSAYKIYPRALGCESRFENGTLSVTLGREYSARLFVLETD